MTHSRRILLALAAAAAVLLGFITVPSASAGPLPKITTGWLPYWLTSPARPQGVANAVANADLLTEVSPFWYSALADKAGGVRIAFNPNFTNAQANAAWAMGQLRGAGLSVWPAIADGSGKGRMAAALADPAQRSRHVQDIVNLVVQNGYDGIDLDYEQFAFADGSSTWAATQPNWTAFVAELGAALRAQGKGLSVTIPPPCSIKGVCSPSTGYWVYNIAGIAPYADRIRIMTYDYHVNGIGPIAPIDWVTANAQYAASVAGGPKIQVGVPTYGRAWTKKTSGGAFRLSGACPSSNGSSGEKAAYRSLTAMSSVADVDIPGTLAANGVPPEAVQWDPVSQENWVEFDKKVQWTDPSGAQQTCTAKRIMWFVGPQAVLVRTQLVGSLGLGGAAYWTIGGEDPAQWPLVRGYAQSLAPAETVVQLTPPPPTAPFGAPVAFSAAISSQGAPLAGVTATLQQQLEGDKRWTDVAQAAAGPDGLVTFTITPERSGAWRIFVPGAQGRSEQASEPMAVSVTALVTAGPSATKVAPKQVFKVQVKVVPALAGEKVAVQIKRGQRWRNVAVDRVKANGRIKVKVQAPKAKGRYAYRVIATAKDGIAASTSAEFRIRVR